MKRIKIIIISVLALVLILGGSIALTQAATALPSETNSFVSNFYIGATDQNAPFFDVILPQIRENIKKNNEHTITPYYDKMPVANNPENFQGLGSTTYANINGQTVTAEGFYRLKNESLHDPNYGLGLMIYQCILYKQAHPEEDVKITFSSYRTSCTAAVCVIPESKYYGYMRSLYGTNYDEHGFVRISFLLTEAARMGIEVTMVNQLNSYAVKQYDPSTGKLTSRSSLNFKTYFDRAMKTECYDSYAPGKKVSDFMNCVNVGWTVSDQTQNMQHVKSGSVSHYIATDGTEHRNTVYFGSANLDDNSYIGANGNNNSQSGVIVSDHSELYRVTYNYTQLMAKYSGQEEMQELRRVVMQMNDEQIALIKAGRGDEIPSDQQIVYLGSETDPVFELYFTPFGGSADSWDIEKNPICKYVDKFGQSTGYVELIWNEFGFGNCHIGDVMSDMVEDVYCSNPNINNKIALRVDDFDTSAIQKLVLGRDIGYRSINDGTGIHSKDILLSYEEDGVRHNVCLMTSCNFYMIAFNHRTNSLLVIHETEDTDGDFYGMFSQKYSYGMNDADLMTDPINLRLEEGEEYQIEAKYSGSAALTWTSSNENVATVVNGLVTAKKAGTANITVSDGKNSYVTKLTVVACADCNENGGLTCSTEDQYVLDRQLNGFPMSFDAEFTLNAADLSRSVTLIGNDGSFDPAVVVGVNKDGCPYLTIRAKSGYTKATYVFKEVNVATGKRVHLTIAINLSQNKINCFVNGSFKQSITGLQTFTPYEMKHNFVIGGDHLNGNSTAFPGVIYRVAMWSDLRVSSEIKNDYTNGLDTTDKNLLFAYDFTKCEKCNQGDLSGNGIKLEYMDFWMDEDEVDPVGDYDYSFAVVGDTQWMMENDPEAVDALYEWILANQKKQKIELVLGMGDITNHSKDVEWERANYSISKLNGKIPYVLVRGNHDDWDDFNRNLHNGFYENTLDGLMIPGDIELTDPDQPGLIEVIQPDGSVAILTREKDEPEGGTVKGDLTNSYRYITIQGTDYLILTLDFAPSSAILDWANSVIEAHPNHKVIVVTHAYMYRDGTTIDSGDCYPPTYYSGYDDAQNGDDMWEKCFSKHENVLMVLSGHDPWQHVVYRQDEGENGNTVTQMLIDAQYVDLYNGANGMVAMFYFSNNGETLTVRYYSVERECFGSPLSQFTIDLT